VAHFQTTIVTPASAEVAFDYLADFSNARFWDPTVSSARRLSRGPIGEGSRFEVFLRAPRQPIRFEYRILRFERARFVQLEATSQAFRSLDTIEVEPRSQGGASVRYDADLRPQGLFYLFDLSIHLAFQVSGRFSVRGLARSLDQLPASPNN